jgi:nicotinate-nucleotide adenylyltransferase
LGTPKRKRHALFGGTFDPIHLGHLDLIRHVLAALSPDVLWVCPAKRNPLKTDATSAKGVDRAEMVKQAIKSLGDSRVRLLDFELRAEGPSYTLLTVRYLKSKDAIDVVVVMGNEVFATLPQWHQPRKLVEEADLFVVSREPMSPAQIERTMKAIGVTDLKAVGDKWEHGNGRSVMPRIISALPFSATAIREAIHRYAERPEGLTDGVWGFIKQRGLYTDN